MIYESDINQLESPQKPTRVLFPPSQPSMLYKEESRLIIGLYEKGIITRLNVGLYIIVPFGLGQMREYLGNPYLVAKEIVFKKARPEEAEYYISHGSTMDLHQMVTQPQLIVYTIVTKRIKKHPIILGTEFRFVTAKKEHYFRCNKHWIEGSG